MITNINDDVGYFGANKKPFLIKCMYSNTIKEDRRLELVQVMLPDAGVTELCLNKNVVCSPLRDKANYGASYIFQAGLKVARWFW